MNTPFFIAVSFGLLVYWDREQKGKVSLKEFSGFIKTGVEIFASAALLALLGYGLLPSLPFEPIRKGEFLILLLLPLSYAWHRTQKKSWISYLTVTGFSFCAVEESRSFLDCLYFSALLAGGAALFQVLLCGLQSRLALAPVPRQVGGLPFLFFVAALVALVFTAPVSWIEALRP